MNNLIDDFLISKYEEELTADTVKSYKNVLNKFNQYIIENNLDFSTLEKKDVIEYKAKLQEQYKNGTTNKHIMTLNSYFEFTNNANLKLKYIKDTTKKTETDVMSLNQLERLIKYSTIEDKLLFNVMYLTGVRVAEIEQLKVSDLKKKYFQVDNKGKVRTVYLSKKCITLLKKYAEYKKLKDDDVFFGYTRGGILKKLKRASGKSKVSKAVSTPHNIRKLTAQQLAIKGVPTYIIADILGHERNTITDRYIIKTETDVKKALDLLDYIEVDKKLLNNLEEEIEKELNKAKNN